MPTSTVKQSEINQFQKDSHRWWEENGPFAPLHAMNPVRLRFIQDVAPISRAAQGQALDIGCGGGLLCEPLCRQGWEVTGLDADAQAIAIARDHAALMELPINYQAITVEDFHKENKDLKFDLITALEIIEHVADPAAFLDALIPCLAPQGTIVISTLNQTLKSWALGIVAAEYILGLVPRGTHTWRQFIRPSTLAHMMQERGFTPVAATGVTYNPVTRHFALAPHDLDVNYLMAFRCADAEQKA